MELKTLKISQEGYPNFLEWLSKLSESEQRTITRHQARTDLYFLLVYVLGRVDASDPWLYERCREVQENPDGYLDLWAREHYKSTIITFALTIQDILRSHGDDPIDKQEATIGIFSHTRPSAKGFLRQIKQEFEGNDLLKRLFSDILFHKPSHSAPKWSEDEGIIVKRKGNPKEATVEAWGLVDGQPIGKHFTRLIYDDVVVPASVTTPDMMRKTTDMLRLSFNLGSEGGSKRFIGTRYHYNDSYKTIIDEGIATLRKYPATDDGSISGEPVLLTRARLEEKRKEQGPYIFACQMMQDPKADETQGFKEEWLGYHDGVTNYDSLNVYIRVDPAHGKKKENDYTAAWVIGLSPDGKARVLDIVRDRLNLTQRTDLLFKWHRKYKPMKEHGVGYERYGLQSDIEHIKSRMNEENYSFHITELGGSTPKHDRIKRLIPKFEQEEILLPRSLNYTDYTGQTMDLVNVFIQEEYKAFPVPAHDDLLDALARFYEPDISLVYPMEKKPKQRRQHRPKSWMA